MPFALRRFAAALLLTAMPLAARAEGVNFTVPDGYQVVDLEVRDQPVYRRWDRRIDGVLHSIVVEALPSTTDFATAMDHIEWALHNDQPAVDISRGDAGFLCGSPSVRFAYRFAFGDKPAYVARHVVAGGRLLYAGYTHPFGSAADPAALAALDTLCSGIHQPAGPPGWTLGAPFPANGNAWYSAGDGHSQVLQVATIGRPGRDLGVAPYAGEGTIAGDRVEACGAVWVRRITASLTNERTLESVQGTVNGYDYVVTYVHPSRNPPVPAALATLTSFCETTIPPR